MPVVAGKSMRAGAGGFSRAGSGGLWEILAFPAQPPYIDHSALFGLG
jgi:hypothetical protein